MRPVRQSILIRALVLAFTVLLLVHFWFPSSGLAVSYRPTWGSGWKTYFDHENPSDTKDEPSDREKQPSHPQEESSHAQEEPSHAQEEPSHAQEEPSHAQEEPSHAKEEPPHPQDQSDPYCDAFVGSDRIVITVKTGATQANVKIPSQLSTTLRCAPNVLIFSDMEQKLGDRQVYDALETIADTVKDTNADFDLYRKQQELKDPDQIIVLQSELKDAAWRLDKYKFIHVLGRSWAMLPDKDWYFHLDADTYVVWSSLLEYVRRLDPSEEVFLAAVTYMGGSPFGYGGGGLLLSRAAMQKFALNYTEIAANWDPHVHEHCCGDWVVSQALKEIGVDVADVFPTFIGTRPPTIPFYDDEWCQPLVTLHHMSTEDDEEVAKFEERRRNITAPLLHRELFTDMVWDTIPEYADDWNNEASGETIDDIGSAADCHKLCDDNEGCFQSLYDGKVCELGTRFFKHGFAQNVTETQRWQSYWNRTRISAWVSSHPCDTVKFPHEKALNGSK